MSIFLWVGFAIAVGVWASNRGRNGFIWFLIACVISPLLAGVYLAVIKNKADNGEQIAEIDDKQVRCDQCAEFVLPQAKICKHCGATLIPDLNFETRIREEKIKTEKEDQKNLIIGILFIAGIIAVIKLISTLIN